MAYFKLVLLTSQFENNKNILLQDIISEFNTQENVYNSKKAEEDPSTQQYNLDPSTNYSLEKRKYSFCYSYDEKFSLTQNAQKTLTFNLDKFIVKEDLREENPFARNIIVGSQLLLVDQYGNNYFFTVKGIDYDIKEINITYKITCQDTFSYQMTRQNAGYTIDNDPSDVDFIGAKTVDWWVVNKIVPECHIGYSYLYMNEGLYEAEDGSYKIFNYGDNVNDVKRIIKDAYSPDKDKDLYETIPFSCSGSNANAALISLGETLDLQIKTFEHIDGLKYFWFEPKKNSNRIGGLVYSPYNSIQSFGLSHKGDSLTTILNVEGPTYDDELITLIPELTPHFSNFINSNSWTNQYKKGMFLEQCAPQHYILNDMLDNDQTVDAQFLYYTTTWDSTVNQYNPINITAEPFKGQGLSLIYDRNKGFVYFKLFSDSEHSSIFKLNSLFTQVNFNLSNTSQLIITSTDNSDVTTTNCSSDAYRWSLAIMKTQAEGTEDEELVEIEDFVDQGDLKEYINDDTISLWIKIFIGTGRGTVGNTLIISLFSPNLSFYREVSQEDIEFAKAADECPWLENKLIDFNYFLENKMITEDEYRNLMNLFTQDLRIINGKLMFYAKAYYKALHDRTKLLADLTNQLDTLGAAANADIVTTLRTVKQITQDNNIQSFHDAYRNTVLGNISDKQSLLNYDDILTDYFNKLFNSEQRFLKNIKKFKDYFNSAPTTWLDPATGFYDYTISITNPEETSYIINAPYSADQLTAPVVYIEDGDEKGKPLFQIYDVEKEIPYYPITIENFNKYYIKNGDGSGKAPVLPGELYNPALAYYYFSNDEPVEDVQKEILINGDYYYRDFTQPFYNFNYPFDDSENNTSVITWLTSLFDNFTAEDYKFNFPIFIASYYYEENNYDVFFVNNDNFYNFYKPSRGQWWWQDPETIAYDVFGTPKSESERDDEKPLNNNFIFCSYTAPWEFYNNNLPLLDSNFGITYNYALNNMDGSLDNNEDPIHIDFFYRETAWFKVLKGNHKLDPNKIYRIFKIKEDVDLETAEDFFTQQLSFGTTTYWPIYNRLENLPFLSRWIIRNKKDTTLQVLLDDLNIEGFYPTPEQESTDFSNCFIWQKVSPGVNDYPFIVIEITNYHLKSCNFEEFEYNDNDIYVDTDDKVIDFNNCPWPLPVTEPPQYYHRVDPYIHPSKSKIEEEREFNLYGEYYKEDTKGKYSRIYTAKQLDEDPNLNTRYKTLNRYSYKYSCLTPYEIKATIPLQKVEYIRDSGNQIIGVTKSQTQDYFIYFAEGEVHSIPSMYHTEVIDDQSIDFKLVKHYNGPIKAETNGQLWDLCRVGGDLSGMPYAVNIAATIEAELETYWQQAYTASLYCRYFLPESWQLNYGKDQNLFSDDILGWEGEGNNRKIYLKNTYIPDVSIYTLNNETILPKYYIVRGHRNEYHIDDRSIDSSNRIDSSAFATNPVIKEFIDYLGENVNNFTAAESGTTAYYYIADKDAGSGCTWSQLMLRKVDTIYMDYSGHYDLAYRLIQKNYEPLVLIEYEKLKYEKQVLWDTLYQTYGYLMLEQNYKNDTATNSSELMTLAKYVFRDYSAPERQHNITVIDATSLKGYKGNEIRIGDGIQIDAQAYYNEYDQIYKSLSQYLFITDISYTLRSPTDISLTVNSIKYQDKLIQRLVKLIK